MKQNDLRNVGLKATLPRIKILEILEKQDNDKHLSAEKIYKILVNENEDIGLATVYRVLTQFESAGLVMRHRFVRGNSVFELNQGAHHDHIVCMKCGKVDEFVDNVIEKHQNAAAKKLGYTLSYHDLCLYGFCAKCIKTD